MKNNNRPISPHLSIYKPQITSILSISHRMSGVFQSLGFINNNIAFAISISRQKLACFFYVIYKFFNRKTFFIFLCAITLLSFI